MLNVSNRTLAETQHLLKQRRADGCQRAASARRCLGGGMTMISSVLRQQPVTIKGRNEKEPAEAWPWWRHKTRRCDGGAALVAAAAAGLTALTQKMMLKPKMKYLMQQLTSWALKCFPEIIGMAVCCSSRSSPRTGQKSWVDGGIRIHPAASALTAPLVFIILSAEASTKRRRLFQRPILNMMPCVGQQKAEEVQRRESIGAAAASDWWERSIHACEEKVEGNNPPKRTRLTPTLHYPSHNLDMAVDLSGRSLG